MTRIAHFSLAQILPWVPALVWMAFIFVLSSRSDPPVPHVGDPALDLILRKTGHFAEYAILMLLAYRPLQLRPSGLLYAMVLASLYAATDEFHQTFTPARDGNVRDWVIDSAGVLFGGAVITYRSRPRQLWPKAKRIR